MRVLSLRTSAALVAAAVGLGGCAYSPYGGLGVGVGYGNAGYYDPYYDPYDSGRYGYGGYSPYYGWYDGYYYPGTGYYVYDRYRNPYYWSDAQRRYWEDRYRRWRSTNRTESVPQQVWGEFARRNPGVTVIRRDGTPVTTQSVTQQSVTRQEQLRSRGIERVQRSDRSSSREERRAARAQRDAERGITRGVRRQDKDD